MILEFTQVGKMHIAEFKVADNFNIHIETQTASFLTMKQRSTEAGSYVPMQNFDGRAKAIDAGVVSPTGIFPMWYRIESDGPVTVEIVTNGEIEALPVAVPLQSFTVEGYEGAFQFPQGITWADWCQSEHNTSEFTCFGNVYTVYDDTIMNYHIVELTAGGNSVPQENTPIAGYHYGVNVISNGLGGGV